MLVSYPALFYYDKNVDGYFIHFPDFENSATQGDNVSDALFMASEYLGILVADMLENGEDIPKCSQINDVSLINHFPFKDDNELKNYYQHEKDFKSLVVVDVSEYLGQKELVKKTLSIPKWANDIAIKRNYNFSQLLTEAIGNASFTR